jgi:hypothetical protein
LVCGESDEHAARHQSADHEYCFAESHVDLAKTIARAKGLPRNATTTVVAPPAEPDADDEDDEDEQQPKHWVELMMPLAEKASEIVAALVMGKVMQPASDPNAGQTLSGLVVGVVDR